MSNQIDWTDTPPYRSGIYWVYSKMGMFSMARLIRYDEVMEVVIPLDIPNENNGHPRAWCDDWKRSSVPVKRPDPISVGRGDVFKA